MLAALGGGLTDVYATNPIFGPVVNSFCWSVEWARNRRVTSGRADDARYFSVLAPYSPLRAAATALGPGVTTAPPPFGLLVTSVPGRGRARPSGRRTWQEAPDHDQ